MNQGCWFNLGVTMAWIKEPPFALEVEEYPNMLSRSTLSSWDSGKFFKVCHIPRKVSAVCPPGYFRLPLILCNLFQVWCVVLLNRELRLTDTVTNSGWSGLDCIVMGKEQVGPNLNAQYLSR